MARPTIPAHVREQQINELPNIRFVRWDGAYKGATSKAVCRCEVDGYEWSVRVDDLINRGVGCHQCAGLRRWTADERIAQINAQPNICFVRWADTYKNAHSKAICRCEVDGFEWSAPVNNLLNDHGCPECAVKRTIIPAHVREQQINDLPNITFVRWADEYRNNTSKATVRCSDNHEWSARVDSLLSHGKGCPSCAKTGYDKTKDGTLYILRSDCGSMVKIGISNNHAQRHRELKRVTPFDWACIELIHGKGSLIAKLEKYLHNNTEQVMFSEAFNGHTEWRKWTSEVPRLIHGARIAVGVAP